MTPVNDDATRDVSSIMNIGFDMIMGPCMRWKRDLDPSGTPDLDMDQFAMATYLAFKGGNDGGPRPAAIVYDGFSIVGIPNGMDLTCLFVKHNRALADIPRLRTFAEGMRAQVESAEDETRASTGDDDGDGDDGNADEIKRIISNMLRKNEMTTPDIRRHFELSNSGIWAIMSDLETKGTVKRAGTAGRAIVWTLA